MWRAGESNTFVIGGEYQASELKTVLERQGCLNDACFSPWVATFTLDHIKKDDTQADINVTFHKLTHMPAMIDGAASTLRATVKCHKDRLMIEWSDGNVWRETSAFNDINGFPPLLAAHLRRRRCRRRGGET